MGTRREPPGGEFRFEQPIEVRFADTDALGHVNNAIYLTYFEAARAGYYAAVAGAPFGTGEKAGERTFVVAEATVSFRRPCFFGETVLVGCRFAWASRSSFGIEYAIRAEGSPVAPARHVADGKNRMFGGSPLRVHLHEAFGGCADLRVFESEVFAVGLSSNRHEDTIEDVGGRSIRAFERRHDSRITRLESLDQRIQAHRFEAALHALLERPHQIGVRAVQQAGQSFHDGDVGAQRVELRDPGVERDPRHLPAGRDRPWRSERSRWRLPASRGDS